jgi:hypothetical protein
MSTVIDLIERMYPAESCAALVRDEDELLLDLDIIGRLLERHPDRVSAACRLARKGRVLVSIEQFETSTCVFVSPVHPTNRKAA